MVNGVSLCWDYEVYGNVATYMYDVHSYSFGFPDMTENSIIFMVLRLRGGSPTRTIQHQASSSPSDTPIYDEPVGRIKYK